MKYRGVCMIYKGNRLVYSRYTYVAIEHTVVRVVRNIKLENIFFPYVTENNRPTSEILDLIKHHNDLKVFLRSIPLPKWSTLVNWSLWSGKILAWNQTYLVHGFSFVDGKIPLFWYGSNYANHDTEFIYERILSQWLNLLDKEDYDHTHKKHISKLATPDKTKAGKLIRDKLGEDVWINYIQGNF